MITPENEKSPYPALEKLYHIHNSHQLNELKREFIAEYQQAGDLAEFYHRRRILELDAILFPPSCKSQIQAVAEELGITIQEFQ